MVVVVEIVHMCAGAGKGQKRVSDSLGQEFKVVVTCLMWVLILSPGPLQEQQRS